MDPNQQSPESDDQLSENSELDHWYTPTRKKLIILGISVLVILGGLILFFFTRSNNLLSSQDTVIATVANNPVYQSYVNNEGTFYPGPKTEQVEKTLKQKVIDDEITLIAAKKQGLIKDFNNNPSLNSEEYQRRTDQVLTVKKQINDSANSISGTVVSIWMYNNNYIGPQGLEKSKEIAYNKIKPLYDKVAHGQITIKEAGQLIASDTSLKEIDPVWQVNALADFTKYKGKPLSFWPEFDEMMWNTPKGHITPLYLGTGRHNHKPEQQPELYIFAKIDKRITDKTYNTYDDWLQQQKKLMGITGYTIPSMIEKAFADDNPCNGDCEDTHGLATWVVTVQTLTGAGVPRAHILHTNGWGNQSDYYSRNDGTFDFGPSYGTGCGANPHNFIIYAPSNAISFSPTSSFSLVNQAFAVDSVTTAPTAPAGAGQECGSTTVTVHNWEEQVNTTMPCNSVVPTLTPTPILTCNHGCSTDADCRIGGDGCGFCQPNPDTQAGGMRCLNTTPTPVPATPVPGTPTPTPPACGIPCTTPLDCQAIPGCTSCIPNSSGQNVCQAQPQCECDGMDITEVASGEHATVTAYAKANANSQVRSINFAMTKGSDLQHAPIVDSKSNVSVQILSRDGQTIRYKATWDITLPSEKNVEYRIFNSINCGSRFAANPIPIMTASTTSVNHDLLSRIASAIMWLFPHSQPTPTPKTLTQNNQKAVLGVESDLQLHPFYFASVIQKSCQTILFKF